MATTATSSEEVRSSVASIYSELLNKRKLERESKEERKSREKEERQQEKEEKKSKEDGTKMTKKERREAEMDSWKEVVIGLTGDDLEYSENGKSRRKYRKWIDDDTSDGNTVLTPKPKKVKKKNYHKEFEPELNMLKSVVADQNKFTLDLQKRFQNAVGPATKDAMPLNKTMVELAAAINASRANSLGLIREIGNLKKTIADLYMKQKKMDFDINGSNNMGSTTDLGLLGSNIASSLFGGSSSSQSYNDDSQSSGNYNNYNVPAQPVVQTYASDNTSDTNGALNVSAEPFDPATWTGGPPLATESVLYETIPHSIVVEWDKANGRARFKAVRDDNGEELIGCPVPTSDPSRLTFNERDLTVRGEFDESFKLEII